MATKPFQNSGHFASRSVSKQSRFASCLIQLNSEIRCFEAFQNVLLEMKSIESDTF